MATVQTHWSSCCHKKFLRKSLVYPCFISPGCLLLSFLVVCASDSQPWCQDGNLKGQIVEEAWMLIFKAWVPTSFPIPLLPAPFFFLLLLFYLPSYSVPMLHFYSTHLFLLPSMLRQSFFPISCLKITHHLASLPWNFQESFQELQRAYAPMLDEVLLWSGLWLMKQKCKCFGEPTSVYIAIVPVLM